MSRYDYIRFHDSHFDKVIAKLLSEDITEVYGLEFQTKDLEREFLEYYVDENGQLSYEDYKYELLEKPTGIFTKQLVRVPLGNVISNFTGVVMFYGKPYEAMYTMHAKFTNGKLKYIRLLSII